MVLGEVRNDGDEVLGVVDEVAIERIEPVGMLSFLDVIIIGGRVGLVNQPMQMKVIEVDERL